MYKYTHRYSGSPVTFFGSVDKITNNLVSFLKARDEDPDVKIIREAVDQYKVSDAKSPLRKSSQTKYKKKSVKATDAIQASLALIKAGAGKTVNQREFDRRMKICAMCPLKQSTSDCGPCGALGKASFEINKIKKSKNWGLSMNKNALKYCGFCGCSFAVLGAVKLEDYKESNEDYRRPIPCWLHPDNRKKS